MTLDKIAEAIGTTKEDQIETDNNRVYNPPEGLRRDMDEYDGAWSNDH